MKQVQRLRAVVQNIDENTEKFGERLEIMVNDIRRSFSESTYLSNVPVIPMMSSTHDGRQTAMLFWMEEVGDVKEIIDKDNQIAKLLDILKQVTEVFEPVVGSRLEKRQSDLIDEINSML